MPSAKRPSRNKTVEVALSHPAGQVLRRFRIVFNSVKTHFRLVEKKAGLAGTQVWAMSVIGEHPGIGVTGLAKALDIHQSTASNLLKPLLAQGLIISGRAHADRRTVHLQLSAQGAKMLKKAPRPFAGVLPQALMQLDERTLARLDRDLAKLTELLGADEKRGNQLLG